MSTITDDQNETETPLLRGPQADEGSPADAGSRTVSARLLIACVFWMLCLTLTAAGHRLYKAIVSVDREVSKEAYQVDGAPIVWVGHGTVQDAYSRLTKGETGATVPHLHTQPNSLFWILAVSGLTLLAGLMAWSGRWIADNGIQSLIGLFAGHFLWLGAVEFGLDAVGRRLGLARSLEVVHGQIVGTHGGGILIQMSAVFLVPVLIGWTMHESNRCALFLWIRRRLPLTRSVAASGRVENYAARTTIQYFMTVWFCYVSVLWLADPMLGKVGQAFLLTTMLAIFAATPYMIWRTACQSGNSQALRYSVSGAIVTWTGIEIAAAMKFFNEPWLSTSTLSGLILLGLTIGLTALTMLMLGQVRPRPFLFRSQTSMLLLVATLLGLGGCSRANEQGSLNAQEIARQLRDYDKRIAAPDAEAKHGLLRALASKSPEMMAQAAVAMGKSRSVDTVVKQRLEAIAMSDESRLSQFAALQALSRLGHLTPDTRVVIEQLAADETWGPIAARIEN